MREVYVTLKLTTEQVEILNESMRENGMTRYDVKKIEITFESGKEKQDLPPSPLDPIPHPQYSLE